MPSDLTERMLQAFVHEVSKSDPLLVGDQKAPTEKLLGLVGCPPRLAVEKMSRK